MEQKDVIIGKNLDALSSVNQADITQAINQLAPLTNIGFIVASATRPDITNNPRFIRYGWLDISVPGTPVLKAYIADRTVLVDLDASWVTVSGSVASILTSMFAARSTTGGVNVGLLKLNADYSATLGSAYYLLRVASNGKDIEAVSLDTALAGGGGIALNRLSTVGIGSGKFIGYSAGVAGYVEITPSTDLIGASRIAIETNILPGGTPRFVARTNAAGTAPEWITPDSLFNNGELTVARLLAAGAAVGDTLRYDGTVWAKVTPSVKFLEGSAINSGTLSGNTVATAVHTIPHGLGAIPKLVRVCIRMTNAAADIGYSQNDEVEIAGYRTTGGNVNCAVCVDATNITILISAATGELPNKGTGAYAGIDESKWFPVVYAFR